MITTSFEGSMTLNRDSSSGEATKVIVFLFAAPLFLIGAYFVKDQRTKTAFILLAIMCFVSWIFAH